MYIFSSFYIEKGRNLTTSTGTEAKVDYITILNDHTSQKLEQDTGNPCLAILHKIYSLTEQWENLKGDY